MNRACLFTIGVLLGWPGSAEPHRLDEYLQATRLAISRDRVVIELEHTPGVSVAAQVFAMIDRDRDERVSPIEIEDYARRVLRDLSLRIDDHACALTLVRAESPSWEAIRDGEGTMRFEASARADLKGGRHRIQYENTHQRSGSDVFLVNVLVPSTPDIAIRAQHRDALQHRIDVDVEIGTPLDTASWWLLPVAGLAVALIGRRRKERRGRGLLPIAR